MSYMQGSTAWLNNRYPQSQTFFNTPNGSLSHYHRDKYYSVQYSARLAQQKVALKHASTAAGFGQSSTTKPPATKTGQKKKQGGGLSPKNQKLYDQCCQYLRDISTLITLQQQLNHDTTVYLPSNADQSYRQQQLALLYEEILKILNSQDFIQILQQLKSQRAAMSLVQRVNVDKAIVLVEDEQSQHNPDFHRALATFQQNSAQLSQAYSTAVSMNRLGPYAQVLGKYLNSSQDLSKLILKYTPDRFSLDAQGFGQQDKHAAYQICMQQFEKSARIAEMDELSRKITQQVTPLYKVVIQRLELYDNHAWFNTCLNKQQLVEFRTTLMQDLGYSFECGRIDFKPNTNPRVCRYNSPYDVRFILDDINTLGQCICQIVHETGHAMYEQGASRKYVGLPASEYLSHAYQEAIASVYEKQMACSRPFAQYLHNTITKIAPQALAGRSVDDVYYAYLYSSDWCELGKIVSYAMQYELQRDLYAGAVKPDQIQKVYNQKHVRNLGFDASDQLRDAVLQRSNEWGGGQFGMVTCYMYADVYATGLYAAAQREVPGLDDAISAGKLVVLRDWLKKKVFRKGSLYRTGHRAFYKASGQRYKPDILVDYLTEKYKPIIRLKV